MGGSGEGEKACHGPALPQRFNVGTFTRGLDHMTDSLEPPYTFDKLRTAKKKEVIKEINNQLENFERLPIGGSDKAVHALNAQFLMQELARRDQNRQANTMVACTIVITFLTFVLVWRSLCGH
jgi:hypothetical protein